MSIAKKLTTVAENVEKVYDAGKLAEYDAFWDSFKDDTNLSYRFAGSAWNDTTFKPKYDIVAPNWGTERAFYNNACSNIKKALNDCGVKLDLSKATSFSNGFVGAKTTELPELDLSSANSLQWTFGNMANLVNIDKVILNGSANVNFTSTFANLTTLEEIRIGGTIGASGFDIHWSTELSADSLKSIVEALSTETSGLTVTLPSTAQATYDATYGDGAWETKTAERSNWIITLS